MITDLRNADSRSLEAQRVLLFNRHATVGRRIVRTMKPTAAQSGVCDQAGVTPDAPAPDSRLGIALNAREPDLWPLNGLRHPPAKGTNGWYIWRGEPQGDDDGFFEALHIEHVPEWCAEAVRFLALPPGWRFLIAPGQEDVWHDAKLLNP